jgi:DNA-binding HxlR family transcriptional regulator
VLGWSRLKTRSLEVIGERWTLLIVRDAFYGVRRFTDFQSHLGIPKAVLSQRLTLLVQEGVLDSAAASTGGRDEYVLTSKGRKLWPVLRALAQWGTENYQTTAQRRTFAHVECGGRVDLEGVCGRCGETPDPPDMMARRRERPRSNARTRSARCSSDHTGCWSPLLCGGSQTRCHILICRVISRPLIRARAAQRVVAP